MSTEPYGITEAVRAGLELVMGGWVMALGHGSGTGRSKSRENGLL